MNMPLTTRLRVLFAAILVHLAMRIVSAEEAMELDHKFNPVKPKIGRPEGSKNKKRRKK